MFATAKWVKVSHQVFLITADLMLSILPIKIIRVTWVLSYDWHQNCAPLFRLWWYKGLFSLLVSSDRPLLFDWLSLCFLFFFSNAPVHLLERTHTAYSKVLHNVLKKKEAYFSKTENYVTKHTPIHSELKAGISFSDEATCPFKITNKMMIPAQRTQHSVPWYVTHVTTGLEKETIIILSKTD